MGEKHVQDGGIVYKLEARREQQHKHASLFPPTSSHFFLPSHFSPSSFLVSHPLFPPLLPISLHHRMLLLHLVFLPGSHIVHVIHPQTNVQLTQLTPDSVLVNYLAKLG